MALASSTRRVSTLFLAVALLFAGALGWLGWHLLQQDRALARQRKVEQLEAAADRISAAMYRRLGEVEEALADPNRSPLRSDAVLLLARRDGVAVRPANGLLYLPVTPAAAEPPSSVFAEGEALEFRNDDPSAAASTFRPLTHSTDPAVRAGALLRLGRSLAKTDRPGDALSVFGELTGMGSTPVGGLPAELVAREARCSLFARLGRASDLQREARLLYDTLADGRFPLSHAGYEFKMEAARVWLGGAPDSQQLQQKAALSAAAQMLWADWSRERAGKNRRLVTPDGRPILVSWISSADELTAVLVPAEPVGTALREAGEFQARLIDVEGRTVLGSPDMAGVIRVERMPASTRLPWTLQVVSQDDGSAGLAGRQWMLTGAFALLVALLGAVSYLAARTASRELAVARLQADFVSAVSHEFRSPLSSICQITELLNEDRLPSDEQRKRSFGRAVWNLLDNAVKYSPESTTVGMDVAMDDGRLAISVRDEGPGIPAAEQKRIFRKFVRGRQAEASGVKGTGIGLAMVRHIVRGHAGEIKLASTPGNGSTFTIVLPTARNQESGVGNQGSERSQHSRP